MKNVITKKEIQSVVKLLGRILPRKASNPVLTMFLLDFQEEKLKIEVNDLMTGMIGELETKGDIRGQWLVSGKIFSEAVAVFEEKEINLEIEGEKMVMRSGKDRFELVVMEAMDFPKMTEQELLGQKMKTVVLQRLEEKVLFATSSDLSRPQLTGVMWDFKGKEVEMVGTDGFRLSILSEKNWTTWDEERLLIPAKALSDVEAVVESCGVEEVQFDTDEERKMGLWRIKNYYYWTNLIEAAFPPYERIIPLEFLTEIEIGREELLKGLNKAQIFARESSNVVKIEFKTNSAELSARGTSGQYEAEIDGVRIVGSGLAIAFNLKYLIDYLNISQAETVWMGINESNKPVLMADKKEAKWRYIVMPFKANN